ncbi:MAG: roadblock/LC7 domain-containing protein [Anaerolineales bacterium]|jgi:predicted regulator of Ras-like GTPase activity (Roadblock/LC7/MglB family)
MYPNTDSQTALTVDPRVTALVDALRMFDKSGVDFRWSVLVDYDGLILASYPENLDLDLDPVIAASAHIMRMGERAQDELPFGKWRYTLVAGSDLQQMVMHLNREVALSIAFGSRTPIHKIFGGLKDVVPALMRALDLTSRKFAEPNTLMMRSDDLKKYLAGS